MPDFTKMSFDELLQPQGHPCNCGLVHRTDLRFLRIGPGTLSQLPEALQCAGIQRPFVLFDVNTRQVAWPQTEKVLRKAGLPFESYCFEVARLEPDEHTVGALAMAFDPGCDGLLVVGSGVLNDVGKTFAHALGKPSVVVCTAPSMDGYASGSSSMLQNGVKQSLYNSCPVGIIADTDILCAAPQRMLWAGLGDMLAKYIAICEWRMEALLYGSYYCPDVAELVRSSVRKIVVNADKLMQRDPVAVGAVLEGLVLSGVCISFAEISRPASGLEHYFSHVWEMMALERGEEADLHGIQVGVGTHLTRRIYSHLMTCRPNREQALAAVAAFDEEGWRKEIRRVFGGSAENILALEEKMCQHDPARHAVRLESIVQNWDKLLEIMRQELPVEGELEALMRQTGIPMNPSDIGVSAQDALDALMYSRDIRDKFLTSSLLWDLGLLEEAATWIEE